MRKWAIMQHSLDITGGLPQNIQGYVLWGEREVMKRHLIVFLAINFFIFSFVVDCFPEEKAPLAPAGKQGDALSTIEVEISVFPTKGEAEKLAEKVRKGGFETAVREYTAKDGRTVFGVFVIVHEVPPGGPVRVPLKESGEGPVSGSSPPGGRQIGTTGIPKDIFARRASYFHAALTVQGIYTDNAFNSNTFKKSDFSTVYSPEFWVSAPRLNQRPEGLGGISPQSSGGLLIGRGPYDMSRRYQAYLHYRADIPEYSKNSPSGNTTVHTAEGGFTYNLASGISLDLRDTFTRSYETVDTAALTQAGEVDRYKGNLFYLLASYDTGNRFRVRFDYSNFLLRYDAQRNFPRNRTDNSFSGYLYYKLKPKTSLFVQYSFVDVGHEEDTSLDSTEHNVYGGIEWDVTAKSKGSVKAGYGTKDLSNSGIRNDIIIFEAKVDHRFTPKTSLGLTAFRKTDETNIPSTYFVLTQGVSAEYQQLLTARITGLATLSYTNEKYGADLTIGGNTAERRDNIYQASVGFQYEFRKWLKAGIVYVFTKDDSTFPEFDYSSNTLFFRITGSL